MNFSQLTNAECGQSNPLAQIASHVTEDHAFRDKIGGASTCESRENNSVPQSFKMNDLIQEMNTFDSRAPVEECSHGNPVALMKQPEAAQVKTERYQGFSRIEAEKLIAWEKDLSKTEHFQGFSRIQAEQLIEWEKELSKTLFYLNKEIEEKRAAQVKTEQYQGLMKEPQEPLKFKYVKQQKSRFDYEFMEDNPMLKIPNRLEKGKELSAKGDTRGAILCYEAAVKQDETSVEAWKLLGIACAEDLQDPKAIYALERGLSLETHNLDILLALSQSYKNKHCIYAATSKLVDWLANHPEYKDIPANFVPKVPHQPLGSLHKYTPEEIQGMFIQAARRHPVNLDYELQCAFGILLTLDREFDKAIDCFRSALQVKPKDSRIWNLLGAALTEANKPEEALNAFNEVIDLDPSFLLFRHNLAMQLIASKAYKEATGQLLFILNKQARGQDGIVSICHTSEKVWSSLRLCVKILLGRTDLKELLDRKDLEALNEEFGVNL